MSKARSDGSSLSDAARPDPPPLNAAVRRHLGLNLRTVYADILSEPPGARLEALLVRLGKARR